MKGPLPPVALMLVLFSAMANSQPSAGVTTNPSPYSSIKILPFSAAQFPSFGSVFTPDTQQFQPAFAVVSNEDSRALVGIAVIWQIKDVTGKTRKTIQTSDSFSLPQFAPVVEAQSQLLVGPGSSPTRLSMAVAHGSFGHTGIPNATALAASGLVTASTISMTIDAAIFADGELVGPDTLQFAAGLALRKGAAAQVAQAARAALAAGTDLKTALAPLGQLPANMTPTREAVQTLNFRREYIGKLTAISRAAPLQMVQGVVKYLEQLPQPIAVFRRP